MSWDSSTATANISNANSHQQSRQGRHHHHHQQQEEREEASIPTTTGRTYTVSAVSGQKLGIHVVGGGIVRKVNPTSIFLNQIHEWDQILNVNGIDLRQKTTTEIREIMIALDAHEEARIFTVLGNASGSSNNDNFEDNDANDDIRNKNTVEANTNTNPPTRAARTTGNHQRGMTTTTTTANTTPTGSSRQNDDNQAKKLLSPRRKRQQPSSIRLDMAGGRKYYHSLQDEVAISSSNEVDKKRVSVVVDDDQVRHWNNNRIEQQHQQEKANSIDMTNDYQQNGFHWSSSFASSTDEIIKGCALNPNDLIADKRKRKIAGRCLILISILVVIATTATVLILMGIWDVDSNFSSFGSRLRKSNNNPNDNGNSTATDATDDSATSSSSSAALQDGFTNLQGLRGGTESKKLDRGGALKKSICILVNKF